jgi:FkbM family methyltransferase
MMRRQMEHRQRWRRSWERNRWRVVRAKRAVESARALDAPLPYLATAARRRSITGEYTIRGHPVRLLHGSDEPWIFHEVFVDGVYDLPPGVPAPRRIADLGGNVGMFALFSAIHWPEAELVAFEPDPANAEKYRWTMEHNNLRGELIQACATTRDGTLRFAAGRGSLAHVTDDGSGSEVSAVDVFPYLETVDLIKMDIEGGEWPLLLDPRFPELAAHTVLMEYHPHLCPDQDPRAAAVSALTSADYTPQLIFHDSDSGVGMLRGFKRAPEA